MYPNFRYTIYDLFGVDIPALHYVQSYGFFLAVAFLASGWLLGREMRRREQLGLLTGIKETYTVGAPPKPMDIAMNALFGFVVGFKLLYIFFQGAAKSDGASVLFSSQGNWIGGILLAALFGYWKYYEQKKQQLPEGEKTIEVMVMPHERVSDIVILAAISGIVGAKALYHLGEPERFMADPIGELLSPAGLTVYGGLILGFFVVSWYIRRKKINYLQLLDAAAPVLIMAYGIGRQGCHWSGDGDWGRVAGPKPGFLSWLPDWLWSQNYPNNVSNVMPGPGTNTQLLTDCNGFMPILDGQPIEEGYCTQLVQAVFPTPVYETIMCFIILFILLKLRKWADKMPSMLFAIYLMFNGLERFTIEIIRINDKYSGFSLSQAQFIAMALFAIGAVWAAMLWRKWKATV